MELLQAYLMIGGGLLFAFEGVDYIHANYLNKFADKIKYDTELCKELKEKVLEKNGTLNIDSLPGGPFTWFARKNLEKMIRTY
ncbi:hypothetical protein ACFL1H_01800 [Nanoarchaeota archaeon]